MTTCCGCNRPIEPLAQLRTYHSGCAPQVRMEMLEKALRDLVEIYPAGHPLFDSDDREALEAARAALEFRPAQMKGRDP